MASKTAILAVRIIGDASSATAELDKVGKAAEAQQATMKKVSIGAGIALGAIAAAATAAGQAASDAQQATGAMESVFGSQFDQMEAFAKKAEQTVGLSNTAYANSATILGAQLKNMGVSADDLSDKTNNLITLGADLASMYGGTTADAVDALSSLLRGERDPIERYGVSINQAAIDAQKAAMGLTGLTGAADRNASMQATLALLTQQTADAHGNFAAEADTAQGQQQRATAAWADATAQLGQALLPVMTEASQEMSVVAGWVSDNIPLVSALAAVIAVLAAGLLAYSLAQKAVAIAQGIQTVAQWASNAAWLASPVTWIILAIIAAIALLVAAGLFLIQHWDDVEKVAERVFTAIGDWWNGVVGMFQDGINAVIGWFDRLFDKAKSVVSGAIPGWMKDVFNIQLAADMSTGGMPAYSTSWPPQPGQYIALASVPDQTSTISGYNGTIASSSSTTIVNNKYEVTVTGAIDPDGTARTIRKVLAQTARSGGTTTIDGNGYLG